MADIAARRAAARRRAGGSRLARWSSFAFRRRTLLLGILGGASAVALRALYAKLVPTQVCPTEGATAAPCRRGEIAPYIVDVDVACFGSKQSKLVKVLRERVGDESGQKLPLWLNAADAKVMGSAPCVASVVRDYNCTACAELNMTVPLSDA
ncbi:hypothetical protein KFE25_007132 [Diacronema lutheri]|uniref:Uncharacterized protein n=1 Tax=Diacronema lutheri TaxID=2081491 RepID=A0A8J6CFJ2_DIALT|nr:hypothetical protein KFE25_007132 [Diacronema lutheri]